MAADGAAALATAHHLCDQAETVLMRLAHGSGIEGLRGMDPVATVEGITVLRPLLGVDPDDLSAVVTAGGLTPAVDPSNTDPAYERVRWRQALPQLAGLGLTPDRLAQFALRMRDAAEAIDALALPADGNQFGGHQSPGASCRRGGTNAAACARSHRWHAQAVRACRS